MLTKMMRHFSHWMSCKRTSYLIFLITGFPWVLLLVGEPSREESLTILMGQKRVERRNSCAWRQSNRSKLKHLQFIKNIDRAHEGPPFHLILSEHKGDNILKTASSSEATNYKKNQSPFRRWHWQHWQFLATNQHIPCRWVQ